MSTEYPETLQLWPRGTSVQVLGDFYGPTARVKYAEDADFREPTAAERRAVRIEKTARRLIDQDVFCCDSSLIEDLFSACGDGPLMGGQFDWTEKVRNMRPEPSSWGVEKCKEWLEERGYDWESIDPNPWGMSRAELLEVLSLGPDDDPGGTDDEIREQAIETMDANPKRYLRKWRQEIEERGDAAEVFEWWRVTKYLADDLIEHDEVVLVNDYGHWWGRCTTGQDMLVDGVFQKVAAAIVDR